jgi:hypothetical protein
MAHYQVGGAIVTEDFLGGIRRFQKRVERLADVQSVSFAELFSDEFMLRNTDYPSLDALMGASGFRTESKENFEAIPDDAWDAFIKANTRFTSWAEMQSAAAQEWMARRLNDS